MTASAPLNRRERALSGIAVLLLLAAVLGPAVSAEAVAFGNFADQRAWHGMANALDVLSNLPFALFGAWGLWTLHRLEAAPVRGDGPELPGSTLDCAWLFFVGLLVTAAASSFFHLQPDALRLAGDRAGMTVAFAGLVGMAVCERVSPRAGWIAAWYTLAGGLLAVAASNEADNLLPWALVQFGGMAVVLALALLPRPEGPAGAPRGLGLRLGAVIAIYAAAKALEMGDEWVYHATGQLVSGHSLKHIVAAFAAWPVLAALRTHGRQAREGLRHNPGAATATA